MHKHSFGWIISRVAKDGAMGARYLPVDSRHFEDYGAYISQQASLWVWSKNGLKWQEEWADVNRGHLIYEPQAIMELMEYIYMLHRQLFQLINEMPSSDKVLQTRRLITNLDFQITEISHFGEIRELLQNGLKALGLEKLKESIKELLAVRESEKIIEENRLMHFRDALLGIFFGVFASPIVASEFTVPLWKVSDILIPANKNLAQVVATIFTFGIICLSLYVAAKILSRRRHLAISS